MRVGALQMTPRLGDKTGNLDQIESALRGIRADLVVLPELCTTGYQLTTEELAAWSEPFPPGPPAGPTAERLTAIAQALDGYLVAGVAEQAPQGCYNSAALVGPEGTLACYRKIHLFSREKELFLPGDQGFATHRVRGLRVGMMVCFDWIFPESARSLALLGADLIAHPANLVLPWCQRSMPLRCLENGVFVITANRCGHEDRRPGEKPLHFTGGSQVVSPRAEVLASAPAAGDALCLTEIDPSTARDKWLTPENHLFEDRRTQWYAPLGIGAADGSADST